MAHRRPGPWLGDVAVAVALVAIAVLSLVYNPAQATALGVAAGVVPAVFLPFRRRRPVPALGATLVLYGASSLLEIHAPGLLIAIAIAMFSVAARTTRRVTLITGAAAVLIVALVDVLAGIGLVFVFEPRFVQTTLTVALASAAGDATRSRREFIESITERAERAERTRESEAQRRVAQERLSIARDLHDAVAHQISVISLNAGVASAALESRPETAREALATIRTASRTVLGEIGELLQMLRADDDALGSTRTPQPGMDRVPELIAQFEEVGLTVTTRTSGDPARVSGAVGIVAYKVLQEGLTNAHKHGDDGRASVEIAVLHDAVRLDISNTSAPTQIRPGSPTASTSGHGLAGMRERVASVGGTVTAAPGHGDYRVSAVLPLKRREMG